MVKYDIYTYDITTDSLFIAFPVEYEYAEVMPLDDDFLMEIDVGGHPRAIEILNASTHFGVDKESLPEYVNYIWKLQLQMKLLLLK